MTDPCQYVITSLEDHSSRLNKEQIILEQAREGNSEFFEGCRLALDSMITFGLNKYRRKKMKTALVYLGIVLLSLLLASSIAMSPVIPQGIWLHP
jgi:uncharacterized protein (UPF0333 family)